MNANKAITCSMILSSASTKSDGSLGLRFSTPELDATSKTAFFELLNRNLKVLIQPADCEPAELHDVKGEFDRKTPSMRLRATLFVWYKQETEAGKFVGLFSTFKAEKYEKIIETIKSKLL